MFCVALNPVMRKEKVQISQIVEDNDLFEILRNLRREISVESEKVPPYIIFSDVTLTGNECIDARNEMELLQIKGVGERKLASYGEAFLAAINSYCEENGVERKQAAISVKYARGQ